MGRGTCVHATVWAAPPLPLQAPRRPRASAAQPSSRPTPRRSPPCWPWRRASRWGRRQLGGKLREASRRGAGKLRGASGLAGREGRGGGQRRARAGRAAGRCPELVNGQWSTVNGSAGAAGAARGHVRVAAPPGQERGAAGEARRPGAVLRRPGSRDAHRHAAQPRPRAGLCMGTPRRACRLRPQVVSYDVGGFYSEHYVRAGGAVPRLRCSALPG
jgi:hypothetical protein